MSRRPAAALLSPVAGRNDTVGAAQNDIIDIVPVVERTVIGRMEILPLDASLAERIGSRPYEVKRALSIALAEGEGEAHVYVVYFEPGGEIGPHEAGFGQLFFAVSGDGWVAGGDGRRRPLAEGRAAFIERGEIHSKGSETGLTALMIQVRDLAATAL